MNLELTGEQKALQVAAREFLRKECDGSLVREMERDGTGYLPALWRKMADLGWLGLIIPAEHGGGGSTFLDLALLLEEMGRALLPGPFFSTVVLCTLPILEFARDEQRQSFLPKIAKGDAILTLALTEPTAGYHASNMSTTAASLNDAYLVNGTKLFVSDAAIADYLVCAATDGGESADQAITLLLVDAASPGITLTPLQTIAGDKQYEVNFDNVRVPEHNTLGGYNQGGPIVRRILELAAAAKCAEMIGGAQRVLELTVEYAKERVQYGRPIGSFQAIQHQCANMWIDVETSRSITYEVAWKLSAGIQCTSEAATAKAWVSEAYKRVAALGVHIHGAIGTTREHDVGLYYRRAKAAELAFGDAAFQREVIARRLGL